MRKLLFLAGLLALTAVSTASGNDIQTASITSVSQTSRHPVVDWTLPAGVEADAIEIASKPDVGTDGQFFTENVKVFDLLDTTQTHYVGTDQLDYGTYYVHIQT